MSLLDTASLIVTPSAYKEGKLYSVIPSDGSGDLSVTRATTATRVNSAGLVELVPYNLLSYSERFENAAWTNVNSSEVANATTAPNGTLTADNLIPSATTAQHGTLQAATLNALSQYTYSIYFKPNGYTAAILRLTGSTIWGPTDGIVVSFETATMTTTLISGTPTTTFTSVGDGWYRCSVTATTIASGSSNAVVYAKDYSPYLGNGTSGIYLWGAQVNEGTLKDYFATETRLNIPRLDYSLGSCPSILVEPQRTNTLTWSEAFDNAAWTKTNASITANSVASPSGDINADTFTDNSTNGSHALARFSTLIIGTQTASIYIKPNTLTKFYIANGTTGNAVCFDLSTQTVEGYTSGFGNAWTNPIIQSFTNGWFRVSATLVATASQTLLIGSYKVFNAASFGAMSIYVGSGETAYLWGAQLELGAYPTSYIPTTSASVTRNADVLDRSNIYTNNWITASGGTWFVELKNNIPLTRENTNKFGIGNTTDLGTNSLYLLGGSAQRMVIQKRIAGVNSTLYVTTADTCKIAIKWNGATADVFENGVKVVNATAFTPTDMEYLRSNSLGVKAYINVMALWPTPISDAELIEYTTI